MVLVKNIKVKTLWHQYKEKRCSRAGLQYLIMKRNLQIIGMFISANKYFGNYNILMNKKYNDLKKGSKNSH